MDAYKKKHESYLPTPVIQIWYLGHRFKNTDVPGVRAFEGAYTETSEADNEGDNDNYYTIFTEVRGLLRSFPSMPCSY